MKIEVAALSLLFAGFIGALFVYYRLYKKGRLAFWPFLASEMFSGLIVLALLQSRSAPLLMAAMIFLGILFAGAPAFVLVLLLSSKKGGKK